MKNIPLLTCILLLNLLLLAQKAEAQSTFSRSEKLKADSLWNVWQDESQHDTLRFQALMQYPLNKWPAGAQPDSNLHYAEIAYEFANQRGLIWEIAWALQRIGGSYLNLGNIDEGLVYFEQSLELGEQLNDKKTIVRALASIAACYKVKGDFKTATEYYKEAIPIYEELGNIFWVAQSSYMVGVYYWKEGNYFQASDYVMKGLENFEAVNDEFRVYNCLYLIGWIYLRLDDNLRATEYFEKGLQIAENLSDSSLMSQSLSSLGSVYNVELDYKKALEYYERALAIAKNVDNQSHIPISIFNIGYTYSKLENYPKSLEFLVQSLEMFEEQSRDQHIAMTQCEIGRVNLMLKKYLQAVQYAQKGYNLANKIGVLKEQMDAAEVLYKAYKKIGDTDKALTNHEIWWALTDSTKKEETDKKLQQYEFDRQRMADSLLVVEDKLRTELAFQETLSTEKQTRNTFMYSGIGLLLIAGGLFGRMRFIRRTNRELEEKNKIIAEEKARVEESEKAKEEFFNNVSHEFRTPLTLIVGPLEEVLEKPINEDSRPNLQIMQRSALRLQGMINELLDLSKLEFKQLGLKAKEENIVEVTKSYLQSFESLADQRKIKLGFKAESKDLKAWIDVEKYRKILANLVSNAMKFTDEGGEIKVNIRKVDTPLAPLRGGNALTEQKGVVGTSPLPGGPWGAQITITDTGIGIPNEKLPHIFDRFFQTGDKSFTQQAGTGIGLALVKELVELHHGTIEVESEPGKGTTFTVFIPIGKEHLTEAEMILEENAVAKAVETKEEWAVEEAISGHVLEDEIRKKNDKPIVLIVEDNPDMQSYIKSHLEDNYKIITAKDGEEGLAKALEQIPDLVISDVMMPKMDGNEMTEKLKTDQRTSHIPVILLTARASVDSKIEGLETGADAYLTKPFNARELKVRVKNLIEQRKKLRELFAGELSTGQPITTSSSLPSMDQQFIQKAIDVVNTHMGEPDFDVNLLSSEMALSRSQLHRKIKALTDKTTGEFIRTIRLNRAAELLRQKTDTVTQIAYETGFNNLSWFAKAFKEQFGMTPSDYTKG